MPDTTPAQPTPEQLGHQCFTVSSTSYLRNLDREDLREPCIAVHYQNPPTRNEEAGTTSFGLRFPMLVMALYVEDQEKVAQRVADILNRHWDDDPSAILQSDQQQAELLSAAIALRDDMLMRAERDKHLHDGELVVEAGAGVWARFTRVIASQYQEGRKDG